MTVELPKEKIEDSVLHKQIGELVGKLQDFESGVEFLKEQMKALEQKNRETFNGQRKELIEVIDKVFNNYERNQDPDDKKEHLELRRFIEEYPGDLSKMMEEIALKWRNANVMNFDRTEEERKQQLARAQGTELINGFKRDVDKLNKNSYLTIFFAVTGVIESYKQNGKFVNYGRV